MSSIRRDHRLTTDVPASVAASSAVAVRAARRLPNELLLHIAGFTDRATSIRLRRVSKGFNAIIDTIRWTWLSFRTQGDYDALFASDALQIRSQCREIHVYEFPPRHLLSLLTAPAHDKLALDKVVYRTLTWAPRQFYELFSPTTVDVRVERMTSFDALHKLWWRGSLSCVNRQSTKSLSFYHVARPRAVGTSTGGPLYSPTRESYPVLDEIVLNLLPGVTVAAFEEALKRWFAALRARPEAKWTDEKEADWRRVLRIKEHVNDDI